MPVFLLVNINCGPKIPNWNFGLELIFTKQKVKKLRGGRGQVTFLALMACLTDVINKVGHVRKHQVIEAELLVFSNWKLEGPHGSPVFLNPSQINRAAKKGL